MGTGCSSRPAPTRCSPSACRRPSSRRASTRRPCRRCAATTAVRTSWCASLAQAFVAGVPVDWTTLFPADPTPRTVDLPTYAFQHRAVLAGRPRPGGAATPADLGLRARRSTAAARRRGAGRRRRSAADRPALGAVRGALARPSTWWRARCWCPARRWWSGRCGPPTRSACGGVEELALQAPAGAARVGRLARPGRGRRRPTPTGGATYGCTPAPRRTPTRRGRVGVPRGGRAGPGPVPEAARGGRTGRRMAPGRARSRVDARRLLRSRPRPRDTRTARPSRGCGRSGATARICWPRWRCPRPPGTTAGSASTRRCSTPRCTPSC